jgi:hypothetical protein
MSAFSSLSLLTQSETYFFYEYLTDLFNPDIVLNFNTTWTPNTALLTLKGIHLLLLHPGDNFRQKYISINKSKATH